MLSGLHAPLLVGLTPFLCLTGSTEDSLVWCVLYRAGEAGQYDMDCLASHSNALSTLAFCRLKK